jgi:hypothetical protein
VAQEELVAILLMPFLVVLVAVAFLEQLLPMAVLVEFNLDLLNHMVVALVALVVRAVVAVVQVDMELVFKAQ